MLVLLLLRDTWLSIRVLRVGSPRFIPEKNILNRPKSIIGVHHVEVTFSITGSSTT